MRYFGEQAIKHWIQLGIPETKYYELEDKLKVSVDYIKYGKDKPAKTDITVSPSELDVPNKELSRQVNRDDEIFNILGIDPSEFSLDFTRIVRRAYELYMMQYRH